MLSNVNGFCRHLSPKKPFSRSCFIEQQQKHYMYIVTKKRNDHTIRSIYPNDSLNGVIEFVLVFVCPVQIRFFPLGFCS